MNVSRKAMQIRGDVPGLLRRGMPVRFLRSERAWHGPTGVVTEVFDGAVTALVTSHGGEADGNGEVRTCGITIDYTDPAALYLSLHWLADRGHLCGWMLPTTHGGRVEAWDGLSAWEVAAVLVSVSVGRVARGMGPIVDIRHAHSVVSRVAYVEAGYALCVPGGLVVPT